MDQNTTIRSVSFRFVDTQTFGTDRLREQIAVEGPGFFDRLQDWLPLFSSAVYPFDPLELQRDVVRLRRFYNRQGFPTPEIDYPASQYDDENNTIHIIFTIREGEPLIIQDVTFLTADTTDYAVEQFGPELRDAWIQFRDQTTFERGERYTEGQRSRIENDVLRWVRNQGFAFAEITSEAVIDSAAYTADINFYVDAGPRARISEIQIEGNETVSERVIRRQIPIEEGDWYRHDRLIEGQRQLFGLNIFRMALMDVPEQSRSSTVRVQYRLQEGNLRYMSADTGYGRNTGVTAEGRWRHRNFMGAARQFTVSALANSGLLAAPQERFIEDRRFRGSLTLRQPYVFRNDVSATISPFIEFQSNPLLAVSDQPFGINAREFGLNSTLLYEIYPFRTVSLQHNFSRALQFTETTDTTAAPGEQLRELRDLYNRSTLTLSGQFGQADDFVNPRDGFLIRPMIETGPSFLGSNLEFFRLANEVTGYLPVTERTRVTGRAYLGRLFPMGETRHLVDGDSDSPEREQRARERLRLISFFAGGSNDLRGWAPQMAGDKRVRRLITVRNDATRDTTFTYEPEGGRIKTSFNAEVRMPFPGLGANWRSAVFLDAGHVGDEFDLGNFRYGAGVGIRYGTAIGFVRLDLAAKLNPDPMDLRDPAEFFREGTDADTRFWRRFRLHLSIGQSF